MTKHTLSIKGIDLNHECYSNKKEDIVIIKGKMLGMSNIPEKDEENVGMKIYLGKTGLDKS